MANYEIITVDQLTNRAPNAYDIHWAHEANDVVEPTYACCYLTRDGRWWNAFETTDEQKAIAQIESWKKLDPNGPKKILLRGSKRRVCD